MLMILGFSFVDSTIEGQFNKRISAFSLQFESSVKTAMISYDLGTLNSIGEQAMSLADMATLQIYLADTLVVDRINNEYNHHEKILVKKDIFASGQRLGKVIFRISKEQLKSDQKRIYVVLFFICLFEFVFALIISLLIATPTAYYFMYRWLQNFPYRTVLSWWIFVSAGAGALIITLLTVSYQSIKASLANPVKSLRTE